MQACEAELLYIYIYVYACICVYMYKMQAFILVMSFMNIDMIHRVEKTDTNTGKEKKTAFRCGILNA